MSDLMMVFSDSVESTCIAWALSIAALMEMMIRRYNRYDAWHAHAQTSHWVHNDLTGRHFPITQSVCHLKRCKSDMCFVEIFKVLLLF